MSVKPGDFKIGLFAIAAGVLIVVAIVVLGSGLSSHGAVCFETYFDGSVHGLAAGSPVELRGIRIGQVEEVDFVYNQSELADVVTETPKYGNYVRVLFSVNVETADNWRNSPDPNRRVILSSNLITDQAYLEVDYVDDPNGKDTIDIWGPTYGKETYIPSAPDTFTTLKDSVEKVRKWLQNQNMDDLVGYVERILASLETAIAEAKIGEVSTDLRALLSDAKKQINDLEAKRISLAAQRMLASVDRAISDTNVPALAHDLRSLVAEVRQTNENLQALLTSPEATAGPTNLPETVARLNRTLGRIDRLILTEGPQIEMIFANFREISDNVKGLSESLKHNPSDLFFSRSPPKSEVLK